MLQVENIMTHMIEGLHQWHTHKAMPSTVQCHVIHQQGSAATLHQNVSRGSCMQSHD